MARLNDQYYACALWEKSTLDVYYLGETGGAYVLSNVIEGAYIAKYAGQVEQALLDSGIIHSPDSTVDTVEYVSYIFPIDVDIANAYAPAGGY